MNLAQRRSSRNPDAGQPGSSTSTRRVHRRPAAGSPDLPVFLRRAGLGCEPAPPVLFRTGNCGCGACAACSAAGVRLSQAGDPLEQEADSIAEHVMRSQASGAVAPGHRSSSTVKETAVSGVVPDGGHSLDAATRAFMEPRFAVDFGAVRIHAGEAAAAQAAKYSAHAYTVGEDVVFGAGQYQPNSGSGRRLLAHELAHVVQQRSGGPGMAGAVMRKSSFKSCTGTQPNQIDTAVGTAKTALSQAARVVAGAYGRPAALTAANRQLLMDHFHTASKDDMRDILGTYISIERAFEKGLSFRCESTCPTTPTSQVCGYAYNHQWFGGSGPIHICFHSAGCDFSTTAAPNQTALVIHEAAHRHAGIDDKAYRWEAGYSTLSPKQAKDNADSYAWFAVLV